MTRTHFRHFAAALAAFSMATAAFAQYVWVDERGVKQFSDMPPPASVPAKRILKQPAESGPRTESNAPAAATATAPASPPLTIAEQNAEFRKRQAEQAEKAKKDEEEAKRKADNAKNCERTRDYSRTLESGERIAIRDKSGERSFLTDEQRARELREARRVLDSCG